MRHLLRVLAVLATIALTGTLALPAHAHPGHAHPGHAHPTHVSKKHAHPAQVSKKHTSGEHGSKKHASAAHTSPVRIKRATMLGSAQKILGPVPYVDSLFTDYSTSDRVVVRRHHHDRVSFRTHWHAFMSESNVYGYDMNPTTGALFHQHVVLTRGPVGSADQCGVHPVGSIYRDPHHAGHLVTFYHAERAYAPDLPDCVHSGKHTRWTIRRMDSWNNGNTWRKGPAVVTQDTSLLIDPRTGSWAFHRDDTGEPHLVIRGGYMYLIYETATTASNVHHEAIARAPLGTLGVAGSWHKWYDGAWSQPGLGGKQSALDGLPTGGRGISYNTHLHRYLAPVVHINGASLYQSTDLMHWKPYKTLWTTGLTVSVWGHTHMDSPHVGTPPAYGYGSIIGYDGNPSASGKAFWLYYMVKPAGFPMNHRYLYRRLITLP